jgi:hypothetical protein
LESPSHAQGDGKARFVSPEVVKLCEIFCVVLWLLGSMAREGCTNLRLFVCSEISQILTGAMLVLNVC